MRIVVVWLVGNKGMLGSEVEAALQTGKIPVVASDVDVDITDPTAIDAFVTRHNPDWIINCAAYTAVDAAEDDEETALKINADGPANLGRAAVRAGATIIHISTDYVFDGTASRPYVEDVQPNPKGAYGRTKLAGELRVAETCPRHIIIRTAWLYGVNGGNFVETMLGLAGDRKELRVVDDQRGTPTYAVDLARAIALFVVGGHCAYGTYHFTNCGETSWYGFAAEILDEAYNRGLLSRKPALHPITTDEYPTRASRPAYSVLSSRKIEETLAHHIPEWRDALSRYFDQRADRRIARQI